MKFWTTNKTLKEEIRILKEANKILETECKNLRAALRAAIGVLEKV